MADPAYDTTTHLLRAPVSDVGYHTLLTPGQPAHSIRESLAYALRLVQRGGTPALDRAAAVIRTVLAHQTTDPTDRHYGIWPWYAQEPVTQMDRADWNWADFCASLLLDILAEAGGALPSDLTGAMRDAIGHAAWAIFRRNVDAGYTNIAALGGGVCVRAGELLGETRLVEYGRRRLQNLADHDEFSEYNSPAYFPITLDACERVIDQARDAAARQAVMHVGRQLWTIIARHFHVPTLQWSGPYARTYSDVLTANHARFLGERTGATLRVHPRTKSRSAMDEHRPTMLCPDELRHAFTAARTRPVEFQETLIRRRGRQPAAIGTTWLGPHACLGSVNSDITWIQRRPVIGHLAHPDHLCSVLRIRVLKNGKDFASGVLHTAQRGPALLGAASLVTDGGDHHVTLNRPRDGVFHCNDLRVRIELHADDAAVESTGDGRWRLTAGGRHVDVVVGPASFDGRPTPWHAGGESGRAWLDAVWHDSDPLQFNPASLDDVTAVFGLAIDSAAPLPDVRVNLDAHGLHAHWPTVGDQPLTAPRRPAPWA